MTAPLRCVYCELDGTLLGADGCFLADGDGAFSLLGARALEACARAGVELVVHSPRPREAVARDARLLGIRSYVCDAGLVLDGELHEPGGDLARAVAFHMRARGYAPEECIAVGSAESAGAVGRVWSPAGGDGERVAEEDRGAAVYEAVVTELAERR